MKYVIIGNGTAAVGAIEGIRSADKVAPITVISTEPYHVYGRPLISYMLLGKTTEKKMLQYRPDDFYEKNNVTTMLGRTVQHIDPKKQTVSLASGESVPYDRLCICTGSRTEACCTVCFQEQGRPHCKCFCRRTAGNDRRRKEKAVISYSIIEKKTERAKCSLRFFV